jgi:hypothetical protein
MYVGPLINEFYENNENYSFGHYFVCLSRSLRLLVSGRGRSGAYGGYKMKEKGYTLQNPIAKEKKNR